MHQFNPEIEEGNIEYKRTLANVDNDKLENLTSQTKWRLQEGNGIAYYIIGINDDGSIYGLTKKDINLSIKTLSNICDKINAKIIDKIIYPFNDTFYTKITIKYNFNTNNIIEDRLLFIGPSSSGKSSIISNIIYNNENNIIYKHKHEFFSGMTSSNKISVIGLNNDTINTYSNNINVHDICIKSNRIITLIDTPGHIKYQKTLLKALSTYYPTKIYIVCDTNSTDLFDEINYFIKLRNLLHSNINTTIILNKCDNNTIDNNIIFNVTKLLAEYNIIATNKINTNKIHILPFSNINKFNYYNLMESIIYPINYNNIVFNNFCFSINEIINVNNIGNIVSGFLINGSISVNDKLYVNYNNKLLPIDIKSIHYNQIPIHNINNNHLVTFVINQDIPINKYSQIVKDTINPINQFQIIVSNFTINKKITIYIHNIVIECDFISYSDNLLVCKSSVSIIVNTKNIILKSGNSFFYGNFI